ncbi:DUF2254 domain-containing protein [Colwellia sp. D2M02]|uniref:DUF2254 domain-containing protein n=1 Tax=Colwellia sp. D2M02 TaxID=2841562 RepID=UPI001C0A527C|nr:DUF2254 domain-containing protein [Colwellia sp. D2M02]MBU2894629.1 DUF2254 domain-containing protein [Colwellia sp. D2M02]
MSIKIEPLLESIRASFWFLPSMILIFTVIIATITIWIDISLLWKLKSYFPIIYSAEVGAIRSLLGTIAASMITVTSIAFSITIVALTLASSQFGPRLLRNFMKDRTTQTVLGVFIANFFYCILVFCALSLEEPYNFRPGITVIWAILMTSVSIGFLIHFIHHVSVSIQADSVVEDVYCELKESIDKLFPDSPTNDLQHDESTDKELGNNDYIFSKKLRSEHSGYVQLTDFSPLIKQLIASDLQLQLDFSPGDYVVRGGVFGLLHAKQPIEEKTLDSIKKHFILGSVRTPVQDPVFAIGQLVEIALRALSPSINDPYTAITCIDKLNSTLCNLATRDFPKSHFKDEDGQPRLHSKALTFLDVANSAFDQIRRHAKDNTTVTIRLLESLEELALRVKNEEQYQFIEEQIKMIFDQQKSLEVAQLDAKLVINKIEQIEQRLTANKT